MAVANEVPETRYVEVGGAEVAYQLFGAGAVDLLYCYGLGSHRVLATILFTDIVDSTQRAAALGDHEWRRLLDAHDQTVRDTLRRHRGREVNTTGDGFIASFDGPARAVRCAQAICSAARGLGIEVRAGLHTGEIELRENDIGGIAVHIGQRVSARQQSPEPLRLPALSLGRARAGLRDSACA